MTQPYPPQPGYPTAPPQYGQQPQAQQAYAPAPPQYGQQPPAYGYPPNQGAYPVGQPQYGQQPPQYGQQPQYQPPAPQLPAQAASLDGFYGQPSAGWGPAWQLGNAVQNGTSYIGVVAQWITSSHLEYATQKNPATGVEEVRKFKNGDPVVNMKVPLNVAPDQRFTEGRAQFYVGPSEKDLLNAAIAAAGGDPSQPPPLGSMIRATKTGQRGNIHGGQSAIKSVEYFPPEVAQQYAAQLGIAYPDLNTPRPVAPEPKHAAPEAAPAPAPQGVPAAPAPVAAGPAVQQQAAMPQPPVQQALPQMAPAPVAQAAPQQFGPPPGMPPAPAPQAGPPAAPVAAAPPLAGPPAPGNAPSDPEKAALLARLTGQPAPAA